MITNFNDYIDAVKITISATKVDMILIDNEDDDYAFAVEYNPNRYPDEAGNYLFEGTFIECAGFIEGALNYKERLTAVNVIEDDTLKDTEEQIALMETMRNSETIMEPDSGALDRLRGKQSVNSMIKLAQTKRQMEAEAHYEAAIQGTGNLYPKADELRKKLKGFV